MFRQVIEERVSDPEAVKAQGEPCQQELRPGVMGYLGMTVAVTSDGCAITLGRFEDEAKAQAHGVRLKQTAWWDHMATLYDGEPTFTRSADVTEWLGGGSDDAGFVQVMKLIGVDREMPLGVAELIDNMQGTGEIEYFDLTDPQVH